MALRLSYTAYVRKFNPTTLSSASNAIAVPYASHAAAVEYESSDANAKIFMDGKKTSLSTSISVAATNNVSSNSDSESETFPHPASSVIAVLPQYTYDHPVTLTIREDGLPHLPGSFSVFVATETETEPMFKVVRERPSTTHRQNIIDGHTGVLALTVRTNRGQLPISHHFEDPSGATVLDLQGNFFVPFTGAKATATLLNAGESGESVSLAMQGSYRNRHAAIVDEVTGQTLVSVRSHVFRDARNVVARRRTYEVVVEAGFDVSVAVGMILALDSRAR